MNQNTSGGRPRPQHATIISGGSAEQRARTAARMAAARLCSSAGERPCGTCIHCRKAAAGIHPDLCRIRPTGGQIRVDDIRAMRADAFVLPNDAEMRVFLIEDADLMNEQAQNAALKILEEPPSHAVFLLTTAQPDALRPTVRSRCALVRLPQAPDPDPPESSLRLLEILVQKDRMALALFCRELEKLPRDQFPSFLQGCCCLLREALDCKLASAPAHPAAAEAARRLSARNLVAVIRALEQTARCYENNCGSGHLAGLVNAYCWEAIHID